MSTLTPWNHIKDLYTQILVLGNGASIAVDKVFNYQSLKNVAEKSHLLTQNICKVFDYLKTEDFLLALNMLRHTYRINAALDISGKPLAGYLLRDKRCIGSLNPEIPCFL